MDKAILEQFKNKTVLVLGDVMLDKYIWGSVNRISPEAPVPVVEVERESFSAGGAANAAANVAALGGKTILVGVVGSDAHNDLLIEDLRKRGVIPHLIADKRPTTTKVRVIASKHQLMRFDYEQTHPISAATEAQVLAVLQQVRPDAIAISDYAKGMVTQSLFDNLRAFAQSHNIPLFVDHKPKSKADCKGATVVKLNHKEACEVVGIGVENGDAIESVGSGLVQRFQSHVVVTRAEKGVSVFTKNGRATTVPTRARQVADVSGAGDTFLAALTLAFTSGAQLEEAVTIANHAAGVKVGKLGAVPVSLDELRKDLELC
jgi:D-beta-D-heptose 7-phosphate kinase/D-beta-D-heptose 1-phosphate adenosyltransferase